MLGSMALRANRDFWLLQSGQLLSNLGTQCSSIAYPLLVLALTHSPAQAGLVAFVRAAGLLVWTIPAGVAADRWSRRRLMIGADGVRLLALGALATAIASHHAAIWIVTVVAFVEGSAPAFFTTAAAGALRSVVPAAHLPAAAATQTGRLAAVQLAGPPIGGALFGLGEAVPFLTDAASYVASTLSLLAMGTPFQEEREPDSAPTRLTDGFGFIWSQPFVRTTTLLFGLGNFNGPGVLFALVVIARRHGLSAGVVGGLVSVFGAAVLVGAVMSPLLRRGLSARAILLLELWAATGTAAFLVWPNPYVLAASIVPTALVIPSSDAVVHGVRIAITPDRVLGRSEAARSLVSLSIAPLGPLVAGLLLEVSARAAVGLFTAVAVTLAVLGTASPALRDPPPIT
jgi:predicted MFS family arabinose efflux permease